MGGVTPWPPREKRAEPVPPGARSQIPQVEVRPSFAPGKTGPRGVTPRTNYSRVNTGAPEPADAGSIAQKSLPPRGLEMLPQKVAMGFIAERPRLQDMVKAAMDAASARADVTRGAALRAERAGEKTANKPCPTCGKDDCKGHGGQEKKAEYVLKLASAVEFIVSEFSKEAGEQEPGTGPGALHVLEAPGEGPIPSHHGQAHHQVPKHPATQKGLPTEREGTQLENTAARAQAAGERMVLRNQGSKTAALGARIRKVAAENATLEKKESEGMAEAKQGLEKAEDAHQKEKAAAETRSLVDYFLEKTKLAEDAINPAQISAGPAVPPETSGAGEPGGNPAGGPPQGPTHLVASNEAAANYTRGAAYANRKTDLKKYLTEPALTSATDSTLQQVFANTSKAGTKISSAYAFSEKTAAARALLQKLADNLPSSDAGAAGAGERGAP